MRGLPSDLFLPPIFQDGGKADRRADRLVEARRKGDRLSFDGHSHWTDQAVLGVLLSRQWHCCAYCGRKLDADDCGDVDHFRPKGRVLEAPGHGGYWWLAYHLPNLYLACRRCNQVFKKNRFPVDPESQRVTFEKRGALAGEPRLLLDPGIDPVEEWVRIEWDRAEPQLVPAEGIAKFAAKRVAKTIELFQLNSNVELQQAWARVKWRLGGRLKENSRERAMRMALRFRPHSIVARDMLRQVRPEWLPSPPEEAAWLLERMLGRLRRIRALMKHKRSPLLPAQADRVLWAIACLTRASWHSASADIATILKECDFAGEVSEYASQLVSM